MSGALVVYSSRYGSTERYAEWVAEDSGARLVRLDELTTADLDGATAAAFLSPVLAGTLMYTKALGTHASKLATMPTALVTVGLVPVDDPERADYISKATPPQLEGHAAVFHLRGAIDYGGLSLLHRLMMQFANRMARKQAERNPTPSTKAQAEIAGKDVSFVDRASTAPLVEWLRASSD